MSNLDDLLKTASDDIAATADLKVLEEIIAK